MKQKELLSLIELYAKTGVIEQPLVRYFDQHGRWRSETIHPGIKIPEPLGMLMAKSRLPRPRIISHDPNGDILHASYVSSNTEDVRFGYVEIQGSLIVDADVPICAPHLQHVAGDLVSSTNAKIDFPELESVKGDIVLISCRDLNLPILKNVEGKLLIVGDLPPEIVSVGDRLGLYGPQAYPAKNLKYVGGTCIVMKAKSLTMPVLKNVGGCFLCVGCTFEISANRLKSIFDNHYLCIMSKIILTFFSRSVIATTSHLHRCANYNKKIAIT